MDSLQRMAQKHERHPSFYPEAMYSTFSCLVLQGRWKPKILPAPSIPDLTRTRTPSFLVHFTSKCALYAFQGAQRRFQVGKQAGVS